MSLFHCMKLMLMQTSWGVGLGEHDASILQNRRGAFPLILTAVVPSAFGLFKICRFVSIVQLKFYKYLLGDYNRRFVKILIPP